MKKTMAIVGLFVLSGFSGSGVSGVAQSTRAVSWGDVLPLEGDEDKVQGVELPNGRFFTAEFGANKVTARLYDAGKKVKEAKLELKKQVKVAFPPQIEKMVNIGGRYHFLVRERELTWKQMQTHLRAWSFDPENLTVADAPVTLATVPDVDSLVSSYHWTIDQARSRLYVLEAPAKKENPTATLKLKTYDANLVLQSEQASPLPPDIEFLQVNDFGLEHGHLVVSTRDYERKPSMWKSLPPFRVVYFIAPSGAQALQMVPIDLQGALPFQASSRFESADEFVCFGLYSKSRLDMTAGAFFMRYSIKQRKLEPPQLRPFPASIVESADYHYRRLKANNPEEVENFNLVDFRVRSDGGLQFIAEQSNNPWYSYTVFGDPIDVTYSGTVSQFDDILVFTLYSNASRDWFSLIRKRQQFVGKDRDFSFAKTYDKSGMLWILYNDLPQNLSLPPESRPDSLGVGDDKMCTVLVSVDPRGSMKRELLFTKKDVGAWFSPRQTTYLSDGTILLTAFTKKSYRIGRFRLSQP